MRLYKTLNTILNIGQLIGKLKQACRLIILYGSCASGTNIEDSDLDLLVITGNKAGVLDAIDKFSPRDRYGYSEIKPVIKSPAEWAGLEAKDPVFFRELQRGIILFEKGINESRL